MALPTVTVPQVAKAATTNAYITPATTALTGVTPAATALAGVERANANLTTPTMWDVTNNQTVAGQLNGILSSNSPLLQQAETKSLQQMNARGLTNSSMAIGAGQNALYSAALPIAQADANTFANSAQSNAAAKTNADSTNAGILNSVSQFNANAGNNASQFNASAQNNTNQFNAGAANAASQYNAGALNNTSQFNSTAANNVSQFNAGAANTSANNAASASNTLLQTQMQEQNKLQLADIEASYKTLMQANASAGELYQQSVKNITDIINNTDLNATAKDAAITQQLGYLKDGMEMFGAINNLNLSALLNF